jgi:hypothetical protein
MTHLGGLLAPVVLMLVTLLPVLGVGGTAQAGVAARATTPTLTFSPRPPAAGQPGKFRAQVPTKGQRSVQLQRLVAGSWTKVAAKLTSTSGVATFAITVPRKATTYRAWAPRVAAKRLAAVATPKVTLRPTFPPIPGTSQELGLGDYPFVSGTGTRVAYSGYDAEGLYAARLHTVGDGSDTVLGRGGEAALSGNGSSVLYRKGGQGSWDPTWGLTRWDSGQETQVWAESADGQFPWVEFHVGGLSADGTMGSFVADDRGDAEERLGVYRLDGTSYTRVAWVDNARTDIAPDGSCLGFETSEKLVPQDDNGKTDAYLWIRATGKVELVAREADGTSPRFPSSDPSMSSGCRYVSYDQGAASSSWEVRVWDRSTGTLRLVSHALDGKSYGDNSHSSISADGSYVAFESTASLTTDKDSSNYDIYLWSKATDSLTLLTPTAGAIGAGLHPEISDNGRHVAFDGAPTTCDSPCDRRIYLWSRSD